MPTESPRPKARAARRPKAELEAPPVSFTTESAPLSTGTGVSVPPPSLGPSPADSSESCGKADGSKIKELEGKAKADREKIAELEALLQVEQSKVADLEKEVKALKGAANGFLQQNPTKTYTYAELSTATGDFADANIIGTGGFGTVYKGSVYHISVAIKVLSEQGQQGRAEFQKEVEIHCRIRHPNIAMLLGMCVEPRPCLVYDLMPNGNLEDRSNRVRGSPALTWQTRVRIAAQVAVALLYLHSAQPAPIIHRDVKPANILLPQLRQQAGDVGLAEIAPQLAAGQTLQTLQTHISTAAGFAYIDPELMNEGRYGPTSDVFSFGVVLLQMLTAKSPLGLRRAVSEALSEGRLSALQDASAGTWPAEDAAALARLAVACMETARQARPRLAEKGVPDLSAMRTRAAASEEAASGEVPHMFLCPISHLQDVMEEPVLAADGNHYDKAFLARWLVNHDKSPLTNLRFEHRELVLDRALLNEMRAWKERNGRS